MSTVGSRIREIRVKRGWSQRDVARAVGISQSTLSDLERGSIAGRSLDVLGALARHLEISADVLLGTAEEAETASVGALTPEEADLVDVVRQLGPARRETVRRVAQALREEEQRWQRYEQLITALEALDAQGMMVDTVGRLFILAGTLGSLSEAVTVLAGELSAPAQK